MDQYHIINELKKCGFSLTADIECDEVQGRLMLIDITNGKFYETNTIGKKIFDFLKSGNDSKELYSEFRRFSEFLEEDLDQFLIQLFKLKIIKINVK
tara:strand:+ start:71 stop:361 length:291 start_codon:yes stop_codon:yes gene_type:complete